MKSGHKNGRSASAKMSSKRGYASKKADSKAGSYKTKKTAQATNGAAYRSAKTGRYVAVTAPKIKNAKKRSATVGRATSRLKTAVTVDLPRSRRSK